MFKQERVHRKVLRKVKKQFVTVTVLGGLVGLGAQAVSAQEEVENQSTESATTDKLAPEEANDQTHEEALVELEAQVTPNDKSEVEEVTPLTEADTVDTQAVSTLTEEINEKAETDKEKASNQEETKPAENKENKENKEKKKYRRATIMHTNDFHGRLSAKGDSRYDLGFAHVKTLADKYRELADEFIMVDAGDTIHGTNETNLSEGKNAIDLLNKLGYKAFVPGNHEFNYGLDRLLELTNNEENTFKTISSNVEYKDTGKQVFDSFVEWEVFGRKIGIFGITAQDTPTTTHPKNVEDIRFTDEIEATKKQVEQLSEQFSHLVALTHVGHNIDKKIAQAVPELDVIIGGHSHTPVIGGEMVGNTLVSQAWEYGKMIGLVHLDFDEDGNLVKKTAETITLEENFELKDNRGKQENILDVLPSSTVGNTDDIKRETVEEDPEVKAMLDKFKASLDEKLNEVIGESSVDLNGARDAVRKRETNLANFVTDAIREFSGADISLINGGSIRTSLASGELTVGSVIEVLPFINTVETINIPGREIKDALEHSVRLLPEEQNGGFLQISGMKVAVDLTRPVGDRIVGVSVGDEPLDLERTYAVASSDFTLAGGDGYDMFTKYEIANVSGELFSDAVINHIKAQKGPINPKVDGRITLSDKALTDSDLAALGLTRLGAKAADQPAEGAAEQATEQPTQDEQANNAEAQESQDTQKAADKTAEARSTAKEALVKEKLQEEKEQKKAGVRLPDTATGAWALGLIGLTSLVSGLGTKKFARKD